MATPWVAGKKYTVACVAPDAKPAAEVTLYKGESRFQMCRATEGLRQRATAFAEFSTTFSTFIYKQKHRWLKCKLSSGLFLRRVCIAERPLCGKKLPEH